MPHCCSSDRRRYFAHLDDDYLVNRFKRNALFSVIIIFSSKILYMGFSLHLFIKI